MTEHEQLFTPVSRKLESYFHNRAKEFPFNGLVWSNDKFLAWMRSPRLHILDFQIDDATAIINTIWIPKLYRGKGWGYKLYRVCEKMAKDFGCEKIEMTPSGEGRIEYVENTLGYTMLFGVARKFL